MKKILRIGTRKSPLALKQVELTVAALKQHSQFDELYDVQVVPIVTSGDKFTETKLSEIGGKGLFTKEIDEALLNGDVDITIHSAKDMPTKLPDGIRWQWVLPREDVRDYYISSTYPNIDDLPEGAVIGTASLRRMLFMKQWRTDLNIIPLRGNVHTRLRKVEDGEIDATILAAAGLNRLELTPSGHPLPVDPFIPSPGQGIIAIHCSEYAQSLHELLDTIHCSTTYRQALIERELMRQLDGSCRTPIAAYAEVDGEYFKLNAMLGNEETLAMVTDYTEGLVSNYKEIVEQLARNMKEQL